MSENITWVALDTSKKSHAVAILDPGSQKPRESVLANEVRALKRFAKKLVREAPGEVRLCYEAGPCGFELQRTLEAAAPGLIVEVVAPSLIPVRPGKRIKTDHRDARDLVEFSRAGQLTTVHVPSRQEEAVRDLVRCRRDAQQDLTRARHRLKKFLLRRGYIYREGRSWTQRHHRWLTQINWEDENDAAVFESYWLHITQLIDRSARLTARIEVLSQEEPYATPAGWLRCFRGIDTLAAMTLVVELHNFSRFHSPRELMSYVGLVPSEHSSGDRTQRGGITKTGNSHVRCLMMEVSLSQLHQPAVGAGLRKRRQEQPDWVIAHADRAMMRLSDRYRRMLARGKPFNKVTTAVAREFMGFIWAVLREGQMREATCDSRHRTAA